MRKLVRNLAAALVHYEARSWDSDTAQVVDQENQQLGDAIAEALGSGPADEPSTLQAQALCKVVDLALAEDGWRFIPAARVLCAAVEQGL